MSDTSHSILARTAVGEGFLGFRTRLLVKKRYEKYLYFFFFFQAEDGIRDLTVTGVQTCALPISVEAVSAPPATREFQTNQRMPISAHSRSRTRRVSASDRPSSGEKPVRANAEMAPPSSDPTRAGIQPLTSFNARVTPSMATMVKKWMGRPRDHKTTTTSEAISTWQTRSIQNMRPTSAR